MDIFGMHRAVVEDYQSYAKSFLTIADDRIRELVDTKLLTEDGICPDALVQLNPGFEQGPTLKRSGARGRGGSGDWPDQEKTWLCRYSPSRRPIARSRRRRRCVE